ncbi:hypothetical protein ABT275_30365 [Streptomyces sp. NPDC001185]|uniref:hypothetical protein n=1 Tax=Streptomyces sp. NPDC001185 TaxID=3154380 RepID=UPI003333AF38
MTQHAAHPGPAVLTEEVAKAVREVAGVAFLRPGVTQSLRNVVTPVGRPAGTRPTGVRITGGRDLADPWNVEVRIVARRDSRALDVARATRTAVEACLASALPRDSAPARISVTVTGLV